MIIKIPTDSSLLYYDEIVQIEGIEYFFEFIWSDRESAWYLNIYDQGANPIAMSIRLVVTWDLLRRFVDPRLPTGVFLCVDLTGNDQDVVIPSDLGSRVIFTYITSDDPLLES